MKKFFYLFFILGVSVSCKTVKIHTAYIPQPISAQDFFKPNHPHFPMVSVHRGGGEIPGFPENCLASFGYFASKMPSIIECDIVMSADSVLYMMHDSTLNRTTTGQGRTNSKSWEEINKLNLKDNFGKLTDYKVPSLEQVLFWGKNKVLFTLDVKRGTPFESVIESIRKTKAEAYSVIITYNATDALMVYKLNPNLMISVGIMKIEDYERLNKMGIPDKNMVAFIGTHEPKKELINFLHSKGIACILGVLGNLDKKAAAQGNKVYKNYIDLGVDILSTDRPEAVFEVIKP